MEKLLVFNGTLLSKEVGGYAGTKFRKRYYLDFTFKETDQKYAIYLGTKRQAEKSELINRFEIGQPYQIYIDESVGRIWVGHRLSINMIKRNGQTIYLRNRQKDYAGGVFLLTLGLACILVLIYGRKR